MGCNSSTGSEAGIERKMKKIATNPDDIDKIAVETADECMKEFDKNKDGDLSAEESKQMMINVAKVMIRQIEKIIDGMIKTVPADTQEGMVQVLNQMKAQMMPKTEDFAEVL